MSTDTNSSKKNVAQKVKGSAFTPAGTMPPDKIKRHGLFIPALNVEVSKPKGFASSTYNKKVKKMVESTKTLRMLQGHVGGGKLPKNLVNSCHYFANTLSSFKSDGWADKKSDVEKVLDQVAPVEKIKKSSSKKLEA